MKKLVLCALLAAALALVCGAAGADTMEQTALKGTVLVSFEFPDGTNQTTLGMVAGEAGQESCYVLLDDWYYTDQTGVTEANTINVISPIDYAYYPVKGTRSMTDSRLMLLVTEEPIAQSQAFRFADPDACKVGDSVYSVEMLVTGDDIGAMKADRGTVTAIEPWGDTYSDVFLNIHLEENSGGKAYNVVFNRDGLAVGFNYDCSLDEMFQRAFDVRTITEALDVFGVPVTVGGGSGGASLSTLIGGLSRMLTQNQSVIWADEAFGSMVEAALGHIPTPKELAAVDMLALLGTEARVGGDMPESLAKCDQGQVQSLEDLKYFTGLKTLWVISEPVSDLSPVADLTGLEFLAACYCQVDDISPLSGLADLLEIYLYDNQITDLSPLSGLKKLDSLGVGVNSVSDLSPVSGLTTLTFLRAHGNRISDISPVSGLTLLEDLVLADNQVEDISPVSGLTNLTTLRLGENRIRDITPLAGLTALTELSLYENEISDISALSGLTGLTELDLADNDITGIGVISGLTALEWLDISGNAIDDYSPAAFVKEVVRD